MNESEKVINGLMCCMTKGCGDCPYFKSDDRNTKDNLCIDDLIADAYSVIKGLRSDDLNRNTKTKSPCSDCQELDCFGCNW